MKRDVIEILSPYDDNEAVQRMKISPLTKILSDKFEFAQFGSSERNAPVSVLINSLYVNYDESPQVFDLLIERSKSSIIIQFIGDIYNNTPTILNKLSKVVDVFLTPTPEMSEYVCTYVDKEVKFLIDPIDFGLTDSATRELTEGPLKVAWFGYPESFNKSMAQYQDVLVSMHQMKEIEFHIVTRNKTYGETSNYFIHEYNPITFLDLLAQFDICVLSHVPFDLSVSTLWKSENKAALSINRGLPAVTSRTPAYARLLNQCGLPEYLFSSREELVDAINRLKNPRERKRYLDRSQSIVLSNYSVIKMADDWMKIYQDARDRKIFIY